MADEETKEVVPTGDDTPDEGFSDAFSEATTGEPKEEKEDEKTTDDVTEVKDEDTKEETKVEKPEEKEAPPESLEQQYKTLQGMFKQVRDELDTMKKEKEAEPEKKEEEQPPPDYSLLLKDLTADLDEEVKKELAEYEEEFDHISRFEGIKREQLAKRLITVMNLSFKKFSEQLQPFFKAVGETAVSNHYTQIKAAHEDFEQIRDGGKLKEWIDSKPKVIQKALRDTYKNGDTDDVIELFTMFKKETNYSKEAPPKQQKKEKQGDRGLEVVKTKEKGIPISESRTTQAKDDDFSSAFAEASSK